MENDSKPTQPSSLNDLPDGLDDTEETAPASGQEASDSAPPKTASGAPESSNSGCDSGKDPVPITDPDSEGQTGTEDEQIDGRRSRTDQADMKEDFQHHYNAAIEGEEDIQKRAFALEQKLHTADLSQKVRQYIWASPIVSELYDMMSEQMGVPKSDVLLAAAVLFYRTSFSDERRKLHDLGILLDNLTLQNQELCIETAALEELAQQVVELENSPFFHPPGYQDGNNNTEEKE